MSYSLLKVRLFLLLLFVTLTAAAEEYSWQGCRRGTPRPQTMSHRGAAHSQPRQVGGDFYQGVRHQLVIMASFKDKSFQDDENMTIEKWNKVFNERNYVEGNLVGSVHDYFYAQSYGEFDLRFDLLYIALNDSVKKYRSTGSYGDDENSQYLVNDLADVLQTYDIDWSKYDWNGDGFVNQLMIIFPGKGQNNGGGSNSIWPHQWWLSQRLKDRVPNEYCEPRQMIYNGKEYWIDCYCALQEIAGNKTFGSFGTICHEYTHCFGFPDFYGPSQSPHNWDLMDYGNNNGSGLCPPGYSAHERFLMGWLKPIVLAEETSVTDMPALGDEPQAYMICNDGYENEFYMVENRQQRGWDAELPGSGLVVFHIDFDKDIWLGINSEMPNMSSKLRYHIFPANNIMSYKQSKGWAYPFDGNNSLNNRSVPVDTLNNANADGTYYMNKPLTNMQVTDGLASFDFMKDPSSIHGIETSPAITSRWYDLQGRKLSRRPQRKGIYIVEGRKVVVK